MTKMVFKDPQLEAFYQAHTTDQPTDTIRPTEDMTIGELLDVLAEARIVIEHDDNGNSESLKNIKALEHALALALDSRYTVPV